MERHGFIHNMMDVKVLILYVTNRVHFPVDAQKIYELCYQDDRLTYFDVREAIPQMVESGHLLADDKELYVITEKGREASEVVEDSLAYPVAQRALAAVEEFNIQFIRETLIHADVIKRDTGDYTVALSLDDELGVLMKMELYAPTKLEAKKLTKSFRDHAELIYQQVMDVVLAQSEQH